MKLTEIRQFATNLPQAKAEVKWEVDNVYTVHAKMFAIAFVDKTGVCKLSMKVDADRFLEYTDRPGFIPAPYLARAGWVQVQDVTSTNSQEIKQMLARAYEIIVTKLPKKTREGLLAQLSDHLRDTEF